MISGKTFNAMEEETGIESPKKRLKKMLQDNTNWRSIVQEILKEIPVVFDKAGLWWMWNEERSCYELTDETDLLNIVDETTTKNTLKGSTKAIIIEVFRREGRKNVPEEIPKTWIQFKNKIVDVVSKKEFEASPKYFLTNPIPHNLGDTTDTPIIDSLLLEWGGDYSTTLKEVLAYCCLKDYPLHRIFLLIGSGSNGKGTYLRLLNNFLGTQNVTSTEMDLLIRNQFHITKLHKKLCCQMSETNFQALKNTSMLKRLSGGDLIGFEYKGKGAFDDYNFAKIIIATNSLPATYDKTDGFYRRWVIIDFNKQFSEKKDPLINIPESEYEALTRWVCNALESLLLNREFSKEGSIADRKERYESRSNPLQAFLTENYEKEPNEMMEASTFYDHLSNWLQSRGHRILTYQVVRNMMKEEGYDYDKNRLGKYDNPVAVLVGLKRKESVPAVPLVPPISSPPYHTRPNRDIVEQLEQVEQHSHNEELFLKCCSLIEKNPVGNAWEIDEVIGVDIVNKWLMEGRIMENPKGTYRLL